MFSEIFVMFPCFLKCIAKYFQKALLAVKNKLGKEKFSFFPILFQWFMKRELDRLSGVTICMYLKKGDKCEVYFENIL